MNYKTALKIIKSVNLLAEGFPDKNIKPIDMRTIKMTKSPDSGFMIHYDVRDRHVIISRHFPDKHAGEPLIKDFNMACRLAENFAIAASTYAKNIYVISGRDYTPSGSGTWNPHHGSSGVVNEIN